MNICLVNGSPRGKEASSLSFLSDVKAELALKGYDAAMLGVRYKVDGNYPGEELDALSGSDAAVLAFPLYGYSIPGALMKLLEDWYHYALSRNQANPRIKVYAIINCGFFDPWITEEAVRVLRNFCGRLGYDWRFAIRIGGGPVVAMTKKIRIISRKYANACSLIAEDIGINGGEALKDVMVKPIIPKFIMLKLKESKWAKKYMERKSGGRVTV